MKKVSELITRYTMFMSIPICGLKRIADNV